MWTLMVLRVPVEPVKTENVVRRTARVPRIATTTGPVTTAPAVVTPASREHPAMSVILDLDIRATRTAPLWLIAPGIQTATTMVAASTAPAVVTPAIPVRHATCARAAIRPVVLSAAPVRRPVVAGHAASLDTSASTVHVAPLNAKANAPELLMNVEVCAHRIIATGAAILIMYAGTGSPNGTVA